jgi:hypothetical protein
MSDKIDELLVEVLKRAMAETHEQPLFRSGKTSGIFSGRTGANGEAAALALRDGLLEIVRSEAKGKTTIEWVRPTPRGMQFVYDHESPLKALDEMRTLLEMSREGTPVWLAELRRELNSMATRLIAETERCARRLEVLSARVEASLRRADVAKAHLANGDTAIAPWAVEALAYLEKRLQGGAADSCTLPELFAAARHEYGDLTVNEFHDGLRRLRDRGGVTLLPFAGQPSELPQPEYALLDGAQLFYYAAR